jgi:hypothetical protein
MRGFRIGGIAALAGILTASPGGAAVKIQMIEGRPVVGGVYVNRHGPYRFLVDTGTTLNHLDPKLGQSIGLRPTFRTALLSSSGVSVATGTEGVEVEIQPDSERVKADGQTFLFAGLDTINRSFPGVKGVLGQAFLSRFDYLLDLRGKKLAFGKREPDAKKIRAPFQIVAGRPVVSTSLGSLVIDSGANWVTLFGIAGRAVTREMVTMTGSVKAGTVARELVIDGRRLWRGNALTIPRPAEAVAVGLLPVSLFKAVYVCNSEGYVILD